VLSVKNFVECFRKQEKKMSMFMAAASSSAPPQKITEVDRWVEQNAAFQRRLGDLIRQGKFLEAETLALQNPQQEGSLYQIAEALIAHPNLAEAERIAQKISVWSEKSRILQRIAESLAGSGLPKDFIEADRIAYLIPLVLVQGDTFKYISYKKLISQGKLEEAIDPVSTLSEPQKRAAAFKDILMAQRYAQNPPPVLKKI
jgi:hypothetical protein